jgi:bacterioferritin-associated ferredoxin
MIMHKCHCGEVLFDEIVRTAQATGRDYREVMQELGAAQICTACLGDLISYCEERISNLMEPAGV